MAKGRHKISKEKARIYAKDFDKRKKDHPDELKGVPEGFLFDAEDVIRLMSAPETKYFVIRFGWKKTKRQDGTEKEMITPILMVLNDKNEIINPDSVAAGDTAVRATISGDDDGGGFLDEADPMPPPPIPVIDL